MLTMIQKRDDFAAYLEDLLQVHDGAFTVDTMERIELELGITRDVRTQITGDPVRYCSLHDIGQTSTLAAGQESDDDFCDYIGHTFDVRIFWEKHYDNRFANTSQKRFEEMAYNAATATKPGILPTLRTSRQRSVNGEVYQFGLPGQDAIQNVQRGSWDFGPVGQPELAHFLQFQIILL